MNKIQILKDKIEIQVRHFSTDNAVRITRKTAKKLSDKVIGKVLGIPASYLEPYNPLKSGFQNSKK